MQKLRAQFTRVNLGKDAVLCRVCLRPLKDLISQQRGIGPECEKKEKQGE